MIFPQDEAWEFIGFFYGWGKCGKGREFVLHVVIHLSYVYDVQSGCIFYRLVGYITVNFTISIFFALWGFLRFDSGRGICCICIDRKLLPGSYDHEIFIRIPEYFLFLLRHPGVRVLYSQWLLCRYVYDGGSWTIQDDGVCCRIGRWGDPFYDSETNTHTVLRGV